MKPTVLIPMLIVSMLAAAQAAPAAEAAQADLPITRVTSFSSGVAYFERTGAIDGDADVLLKFKTEEINDILKSLVLTGNVSGVSYGSREPIQRALKSFGIDISDNPTVAGLLSRLRGAQVTVSAPDAIAGKILSVETRTRHIVGSDEVVTQEVLDLLTDKGIRAIVLENVTAITLTDEKLNAELNKALALLVESRDSNRKPVTIHFTGQGKRDVRIGYIAEAPIWKTSYRLILGEKDISLQGWAIVENTGDDDWTKVDLTLVSGRPISFIQDLYTPLYVPRPVVQPELYASLRPQVYEEGLEKPGEVLALKKAGEMKDRDMARRAAPMTAAPPAPGRARAAGYALADEKAKREALYEQAEKLQQGVASVASAASVGEMFSYNIKDPVTIERRKSAMLPIVNQKVDARKVSIFNEQVLAKHPLNGLWLINDTGLSLLAGPVTVFADATYAGDARIDNLSAKDKRLLSYAIDLNVTVDPSDSNTSAITAVKIVRGVLHVTRKYRYTKAYVIKNKAEKARMVLIEHPRRGGLKLISPDEPDEKTPAVYRFETEVPAGKTGKFDVVEERIDTQTIAILPADVSSLSWYTTSGEIPEKVRKAVADAVARKTALTAAEQEVRDHQQKIAQLRNEQAQVRANMGALAKDSTGYQRFEKKLLDTETEIEKLQEKLTAAEEKVKDLRKALEDYLQKLDVE